jgi:hypothetical protein
MPVPFTFATATSAIPLSQLDSNFATTITLGNTAIQLGNTVTTLNNMTLANVTISGGSTNLTSETISGNLTFTSTGNRILGDFTNATVSSRTIVQTSTANSSTGVYAIPSGTSTAASWQATNNSNPTNASKILIATNGSTDVQLVSGINGSGTYLPLTFYTNGSEQMRLDTSGNLGIGTASPAQKLNVIGNLGVGTNSVTIGATREVYIDCPAAGTSAISYSVNGTLTGYLASNASFTNLYTYSTSALLFGTNNTERMRLDSSGNFMVGTSSQIQSGTLSVLSATSTAGFRTSAAAGGGIVLDVSRTSATGDMIYFRTSSTTLAGYISCPTGTTTSYVSVSDYRLKENVAPMTGALSKMAQLKPCTYTWKSDGSNGQGFIAHELQAVVPDCVVGEKDAVDEDGNIKPQGIDTSFLVATLTAAIQELKAELDVCKAEIAALKGAK